MRRWWLPLISLALLAASWWLRGNTNALLFVVPASREVLYATTFTEGIFAEEWSTQDRRGYRSEIVDDRLQLTIEEAVFLLPGTPDALRAVNRYTYRDFDYRALTTALEGPENNSFGLVFRQSDPSTYYIFYISSDGYYSVWRETPNGRIALSAWIPSDAIRQGTDGIENTMRVVANGDTFQFFVNGEPLMLCIPNALDGESTYVESSATCVEGEMQPSLADSTSAAGQLGVIITPFASGQLTVAFDNLVILSPE